MNGVQIVFLFLTIILAWGCTEVPEAPEESNQLNEKNMDSLVVKEPLYFFNNQFLSKNRFLEESKKDEKNPKSPKIMQAPVSKLKLSRLEMSREGVLYTMGANIQLDVTELVSDNGLIATFPQDQKAPVGENGRSGGHIFLNIHKGEGQLSISMQGEAGGDGNPGRAPDASLQGKKGEKSDTVHCPILPKAEVNGKPGGPGKKGYTGVHGFKGGNTGTLEVSAQNSYQLSFNVSKNPGVGGNGGPGGMGGAGGLGGDAPELIVGSLFDKKCKRYPGPAGPVGETGDPGNVGADGDYEGSCISKNGTGGCYK